MISLGMWYFLFSKRRFRILTNEQFYVTQQREGVFGFWKGLHDPLSQNKVMTSIFNSVLESEAPPGRLYTTFLEACLAVERNRTEDLKERIGAKAWKKV